MQGGGERRKRGGNARAQRLIKEGGKQSGRAGSGAAAHLVHIRVHVGKVLAEVIAHLQQRTQRLATPQQVPDLCDSDNGSGGKGGE